MHQSQNIFFWYLPSKKANNASSSLKFNNSSKQFRIIIVIDTFNKNMHTAATCITLNDSLAEVTYLLIRFSKTKSFLWGTNNIDRKYISEHKEC